MYIKKAKRAPVDQRGTIFPTATQVIN